ncbi:MAG: DUF1015 domain-containing protein [Phycisphaerales bacterium]|nr:DUF1015 domain-containing protein [Phycisphaerales bacterium]
MPRLHSFSALLPPANRAAQVASVPYDTVSTEEAAALAAERPYSFLHVVRPEIDLPPGTDPHGDEAHAQARAALERLCRDSILCRQATPTVFVYRMAAKGHRQIGVVGCCEVAEYESGLIRRHERTRPDKEDDRTRHIVATRAHTEPVLLAYRDDSTVDDLVRCDTNERPLFHFLAPDGVTHTVWAVRDPEAYASAFAAAGPAWIADGHHRTAAAARAAETLGPGEAERFLSLLVPASQLRVLPYHRLVRDAGGRSSAELRRELSEIGPLRAVESPEPLERGSVAVLLGDQWWRLELPQTAAAGTVEALDVALLQEHVLRPVLGIEDPRTDARLDFVGGSRGTQALEHAVRTGEAVAAIAMFPTSIEELMAIADAGGIMPPKSTWFDPKPRSGLFVHPFD